MAALQLALVMVVLATPASAYIGPGVGAGAIAVVLGVLASLAMASMALLWFPVKRLIKKRQKNKDGRRAL